MANENENIAAQGSVEPLSDNDRMLAFIDEERATNTRPWWERTPFGGKSPALTTLRKIELYRRDYGDTANPLFVWAALQIWATLPEPAAEQVEAFRSARKWIDDYMLDCASKLMETAKNPPPKDVSGAIADALGFHSDRGRGSAFSDLAKRLRDERLALEVFGRLRPNRYKEELAIREVSTTNGLSETTVGDAWRDFQTEGGSGSLNSLFCRDDKFRSLGKPT